MPEPDPTIGAILFDFNGTLSDDEPVLLEVYAELFAEHGRPLTAHEYETQLAGNTEEWIIGAWLGVEGAELEALVAERIARYQQRTADGSTIREHTRAAVRAAAPRVPVGIVSGAFLPEIAPVIEAAGLATHFRCVVTAEDVVHGKPAPEGYRRALELLGSLPPHEVLAFEDTEAGATSARAAGLRCVGLRGTVAADRLAMCEELVDRIDVALVERLLG